MAVGHVLVSADLLFRFLVIHYWHTGLRLQLSMSARRGFPARGLRPTLSFRA